MNVPLMVVENNSSISVFRNREAIEVPFDLLPSKPYILIESTSDDPNAKKYLDLATKNQVNLIREEFESSKAAMERFISLKSGRRYHARILEQILLDHPDFFSREVYRNTEPLRICILDIEVLSDGSGVFPRPSNTPIISIGAGDMTVDEDGIHMGEVHVFMDYEPKGTQNDRKILEQFLSYFSKWDPDIVVGYNHRGFDIPFVIQRLSKYKDKTGRYPKELYPGILTRTKELPFSKKTRDDDEEGTSIVYDLQGRIIMDLYDNVLRDQSLLGVKDRKLKTLLRWFDYVGNEIVEIDTKDMRKYVNTPELKKYQVSDIMGEGDCLFRNYFPQVSRMAELMKMPLDSIINGYSSTVPKIYTGRRCMELGLIPLDNNELRYGDTRFEAAYVDIMKHGRFETVHKVDFASLYPTIMMTFNLGPDTTRMCTMGLPYDPNRFEITKGGGKLLIEIPDFNLQRNMLVEVDITKDSFVRKDLLALAEIRQRTKNEMKTVEEGSPKWTSLNSENWAVKVIMNAVFGFHGLKYAKFGDMSISVAVVAIARWLIKEAVNRLGDSVIEVDTDGVYTNSEPNVDEMNNMVAGMIAKATGQKSYLRFEGEGPWAGYFYKAKNYILRKQLKGKTRYIIHGNSMKSTKTSKVYDAVIQSLSKKVVDGEGIEELKKEVMRLRDLRNYDLHDFQMHVRLGKSKYDSETMSANLIGQMTEVLKKKPVIGDVIDYYKTNDESEYRIVNAVTSVDQLDQEYYLRTVSSAQKIFGLEDIHKTPQQIAKEARRAKVLRLMRRKAALSKEPTENHLKEFSDLPLPRGAAEEELATILKLQEAMSKKWPCPNCRGIGYDVEGLTLRCLGCGWTGTPVKPLKKKPARRQKDTRHDGSIIIKAGEETIVLPPDWRTQKEVLEKKYEDLGHLTKEEYDIVQYGKEKKPLAKDQKAAPDETEERKLWTCKSCGRTFEINGREIRECPRCQEGVSY